MRNRILRHVRVRAGDLVPHELNPRVHSDAQRRALQMLYDEIGFARSLLAYPLADGRLKLIDGHLRAAMTPDEEVEVEVLDVNDAEARAFCWRSIRSPNSPAMTPTRSTSCGKSSRPIPPRSSRCGRRCKRRASAPSAPWQATTTRSLPEQFYVLVECADEVQQRELLARFQEEGLTCQAKMA